MSAPATRTRDEQADPRRVRALEPYLARLAGWSGAAHDGPSQIRVGPRAVRVETWERELLRDADAPAGSGRADLAGLLAQGLALATKSLVDLQRLENAGGHRAVDLFALQADLMLDAAIGMALLRELQEAVDALVRGGRVGEARRITAFRHRIHRLIGEVKHTISDSEQRRAEGLAGDLGGATLGRLEAEIDERVEQERVEQEQRERERPSRLPWRPRARRRRKGAADAPHVVVPGRTAVLAAAVVAAGATWLGLIAVPLAVGRATEPRPVAILHTGPVVDVTARAPSVFVTLDAAAWDALDDAGRLRVVHDVVRGVPVDDWAGAFFRTTDGRPVARWLRFGGVALLRSAEVPAPGPPDAFVGPLAPDSESPTSATVPAADPDAVVAPAAP